jgi:hypothetical protein
MEPACNVASASIVLTTAQHQFDPGIDNQGFWSTSIFNEDINDNYFCGANSSGDHRSFFTFFVTALPQPVVSAALSVQRGVTSSVNPTGIELFHVSTPANVLNSNDGFSSTIYSDLGSGMSYGLTHVPGAGPADESLLLPINSQGIADLTNAAGGCFSIGARLENEALRMFGDSDGYTAQLILRTVPEPSSWLTMAVATMCVWRRGRRK